MSAVVRSAVTLSCVAGVLGAQATPNRRDALLVTPAWLTSHLHDPNLVVLHVGDPKNYAGNHIAGARFVSLDDISVSDHSGMNGGTPTGNGLMLEMLPAEKLRATLASLGINDNSRIIVYSADEWVSPSTRLVFTLDYAGLGSRTAVMDGGLEAWVREKGAVTDVVPPAAQPGKLSALTLRPIVVDAEYVRTHAGKPGVSIVDARSAVFYDGIPRPNGGRGEPPPRLGHIPGAKSLPFDQVNDDQIRLKSADELVALFTKAGVQPGDTVVGYCHIGQQATAMLFAARSLGHPVLLYDGSFEDWAKHSDFAVELPPKGRP
ncbi:MAG TPA: rhodanese-like domain-containing protein [Gemmatimonadaceae bacterium]|nr:rhodanese-like domain-containing protein [Gemmatimonadaceae bacterium]